MMNHNEKLEIAKRLRFSPEKEMSRDDLEALLAEELAKPEAEMDAGLVQMILEVLEDGPSPEQQRESWKKIDQKLASKHRWSPVISGLARIAAIGAILVALLFATYGTAKAFKWEFLLRLMKPFAETFTVYSGDTPAPTVPPVSDLVYGNANAVTDTAEFASLDDCPDQIAGYPAKPVWMPEQFSYVQGSMFSNSQMTSITHVFISGDGACIMDVSVLNDVSGTNAYQFEQQPAENTSVYAAGCQIAFYTNTDNATLTASWVYENASYCISGSITQEEIISIIESMMK